MKKTGFFPLLATFCLIFLLSGQTAKAAGFVQDVTGVKYQNDDGSFVSDAWVQIGQNIYHLDANGIVQTGWIQVGSLWYLLDANGVCTNPNGAVSPSDPALSAAASTPPAPSAPATAPNPFEAAGWVPFQTANAVLLNDGLAAGLIGFDGLQYWAEPTFAAAAMQTTAQINRPAANIPQQDPALPAYVWLSATGKKYHRINNCGNMDPNRATPVTVEEAIRLGKQACKNCF